MHLVKAKQIVTGICDENGAIHTYHAGDLFKVRNQTLKRLLAEGKVEIPCEFVMASVYDFSDCGVIVTGGDLNAARQAVGSELTVTAGAPSLQFGRTLLWDTTARLRSDLIPVGFERLAHGWQVAAPLASYRLLARDIGDDAGRKLTEGVIHDLRVPFYDVRVLFLRDCAVTRDLLRTYSDELKAHPEPRLAFMRALYRVKPVMCALPASWVGK